MGLFQFSLKGEESINHDFLGVKNSGQSNPNFGIWKSTPDHGVYAPWRPGKWSGDVVTKFQLFLCYKAPFQNSIQKVLWKMLKRSFIKQNSPIVFVSSSQPFRPSKNHGKKTHAPSCGSCVLTCNSCGRSKTKAWRLVLIGPKKGGAPKRDFGVVFCWVFVCIFLLGGVFGWGGLILRCFWCFFVVVVVPGNFCEFGPYFWDGEWVQVTQTQRLEVVVTSNLWGYKGHGLKSLGWIFFCCFFGGGDCFWDFGLVVCFFLGGEIKKYSMKIGFLQPKPNVRNRSFLRWKDRIKRIKL